MATHSKEDITCKTVISIKCIEIKTEPKQRKTKWNSRNNLQINCIMGNTMAQAFWNERKKAKVPSHQKLRLDKYMQRSTPIFIIVRKTTKYFCARFAFRYADKMILTDFASSLPLLLKERNLHAVNTSQRLAPHFHLEYLFKYCFDHWLYLVLGNTFRITPQNSVCEAQVERNILYLLEFVAWLCYFLLQVT